MFKTIKDYWNMGLGRFVVYPSLPFLVIMNELQNKKIVEGKLIFAWWLGYIFLNVFFGFIEARIFRNIFKDFDYYKLIDKKFRDLSGFEDIVFISIWGAINVKLLYFFLYFFSKEEVDLMKFESVFWLVLVLLSVIVVVDVYMFEFFFLKVLMEVYNNKYGSEVDLRKKINDIKIRIYVKILLLTPLFYVLILMRYINPYFFLMMYVLIVIFGFSIYMISISRSLLLSKIKLEDEETCMMVINKMEVIKPLWVPESVWRFYEKVFVKDIEELFKKS